MNRTDGGRTARFLLDGLLLALPTAVLVGVFLAPVTVRRSLVFEYGDPSLVTALTANYVHFSLGHLATNVLSYLLVVTLAYLLSTYGGFGDLFRAASVAFLVGLAPALSLLNLAVPRPGTAYGFSGVTMAFYGLLCFSLGRYAERRVVGTRANLPQAVFLVAVALVGVVVGPSVPIRTGVAALALSAATLHVVSGDSLGRGDWAAVLGDETRGGLLVAGAVVVVASPAAAFPANPRFDGGVVNLYGHFLGFALGFISVWGTDQIRRWMAVAGDTADVR